MKCPLLKRAAALLLTIMLSVATAACDTQPDDSSGPTRIRVTAVTVPETPWHEMWTRFENNAAELAPDRLAVELFILAQFGPEKNMIANLRRNRVQIAGLSLQGAAQLVPELNLLLAPFLFESRQELDYVLDEHLLATYSALLEKKGLTILQWADVGWTHLYTQEPMTTPSDFEGRRMRASRAAGARVFGRAIGMNQIVLPFTDVLPALQTGLVDGGQSGLGMYALAGIAREAPQLVLTAHAYDAGLVVANAEWWDSLDGETRQLVRASLDSVEEHRRNVRRMLENMLVDLRSSEQTSVHELTPQQRRQWYQASRGATEELIEEIGGETGAIYRRIQAGKDEFSMKHPDIQPEFPIAGKQRSEADAASGRISRRADSR